MSVGSDYATAHGVKVGDVLTVVFKGGKPAKLRVAAITSDQANVDKGAMYTNVTTAARYLPADRMPHSLLLLAGAEDGRETQAYQALKDALAPYPQYKVSNQADYKEELRDQVGQLLNIVYGLSPWRSSSRSSAS